MPTAPSSASIHDQIEALVRKLSASAERPALLSLRDINLPRLLFSAHFVFEAEKP